MNKYTLNHYQEIITKLLCNPLMISYINERFTDKRYLSGDTLPKSLLNNPLFMDKTPQERALGNWITRTQVDPKRIAKMKIERLIRELDFHYDKQLAQSVKRAKEYANYKRKEHGYRIHGGGWFNIQFPRRMLCLDCRSVNSHAPNCMRDEKRMLALPISARVPKRDASTLRWKQFGKAMGGFFKKEFAS